MALFFGRKGKQKNKEEQNFSYAPMDEEPVCFTPEENIAQENRKSASLQRKKGTGRQQVVSLCEEVIDISRELEAIRTEYQGVVDELNDMNVLKGLPEVEKQPIIETAKQIVKLEDMRKKLLKNEKNLTDEQLEKMAEEEASIPRMVKRLQSNETYLDAIKKDMHFLEGEKMEWSMLRHDLEKTQKTLRLMTFLLIAVFSLSVLILLILRMYTKNDIMLMLLTAAFITTLLAVYILFKYQDINKEIKKCDLNRNQAINLQNHVKLKYVNIKNAVDYTCEKYNVRNSYELTYQYEQYMKTVREQEQFKQTNDDLEFYYHKLATLLEEQNLKETSMWPHYANAIINETEMAKVKEELLTRKQKLHSQMEMNMKSIGRLKHSIVMSSRNMGEVTLQVDQIVKKLDELTQ